MQKYVHAFLIAWMTIVLMSTAIEAKPVCIYTDAANPNHQAWWEEYTLVTSLYGTVRRFPNSMGGGTGVMTRVYVSERDEDDALPVLLIDLADVARPGAPTSAMVLGGNVYWPDCAELRK